MGYIIASDPFIASVESMHLAGFCKSIFTCVTLKLAAKSAANVPPLSASSLHLPLSIRVVSDGRVLKGVPLNCDAADIGGVMDVQSPVHLKHLCGLKPTSPDF